LELPQNRNCPIHYGGFFVEYLRQFLIDLNQIHRYSSVPQNTSPCIFWRFLAQAVSEQGAVAMSFFGHVVHVTV